MSAKRQPSIRQAAMIQFVSKASNVVVQIAVVMVLARLVTPGEFGLMAIVTVFTSFFVLVSDMGLSTGIVQYPELDSDDLSGLFLFSAIVSVVLAVLFALLSFPVSALFGAGQLRELFLFAAVGVFFAALNSVPNGILRREKRFFAMGIRLVAVNVATGGAAVALALAGAGCYALVAQFVLSCALSFAWNMVLSGLRVRRVPMLKPLKVVFGFSAFQLAHGFVNYFSRNMDNLLVGLFFGSTTLGLYDKAYRLSTYPVGAFNSVIASVLHPFLAEYRDDSGEIYRRFLKLIKGLFAIGVFVSACCVAASDEVMVVAFGGQWSGAGVLFMALVASAMFQVVSSMTGPVFQSLGRTREMFLTAVANTAIALAAILCGVASGDVVVLACLVSLSYFLNPIATFYLLVAHAFCMPIAPFVREMLPQLAVAAIMLAAGVAVRVLVDWCALPFWPVVPLVAKSGVCAAGYAALLAATGQWRYVQMLIVRGGAG